MGCQQSGASILQWQAPAIARYRDEADVACIRVRSDLIEQATNVDTTPELCAIETARTIKCGLQFVPDSQQFVIREIARVANRAASGKPPALHIKRARRVRHPA